MAIGLTVLSYALRVCERPRALSKLISVSKRFPVWSLLAEHENRMARRLLLKSANGDAILLGAVDMKLTEKTVFTKRASHIPRPQLAGYAQVILNRRPARPLCQLSYGETGTPRRQAQDSWDAKAGVGRGQS